MLEGDAEDENSYLSILVLGTVHSKMRETLER